jgi:glycosyltransferase involved in cell wall biosynthesis
MTHKTLIIIPAYNEESTILDVIGDIRAYMPGARIVVVDDGSKDSTFILAEKEADFSLQLPYHLGLGAALQTGYLFACDNGYDIAVHFDSDGQHMAEYIDKIIDPIRRGECDMALGSRFIDKCASLYRVPLLRRMASSLISYSLYPLVHKRIKDPTSGFRAMNRKMMELFCRYYPSDYPEVEELLILAKNGLSVKEVPVKMRLRLKGKSSITPFKAIFYMFKVFLILFLDILWAARLGEARTRLIK